MYLINYLRYCMVTTENTHVHAVHTKKKKNLKLQLLQNTADKFLSVCTLERKGCIGATQVLKIKFIS